jgi:transposase
MGVREFREVSDYEWEVIRPFLPPMSRVGRPRADDRMVLNGILYVLTTGCRWCDMPAKYGSYKTAWRRLQELVDGLSGRPRELYADAAYDTESIRRCLESMGIEPNIPVNPRNGRRPRPYNVERFFGWIKSFRRILIRYERLAVTYRAFINIACIIIHLRYRC